jgi:hypothetical protein
MTPKNAVLRLCPACRTMRRCRAIGTATIASHQRPVLECCEQACGLQWVPPRTDLAPEPKTA